MSVAESPVLPRGFEALAEEALDFAGAQVKRLVTTHPDRFPAVHGERPLGVDAEAWTNWCEGFLGGMMWIFAARTGDP